MKVPFLDLARMHQPIKKELMTAFERVVDSNAFIQGSECAAFEEEFAAYCGAKYCVGTGNALDALRIILQAYGIGAGDEVIVPANTFIASVLAISYVGATPVLVDADEKTFNIDVSKIESKITSRTKAILVVHLYGRAVEMEQVWHLAQKYDLKIVEDCAQGHGTKYKGRMSGNLGDAAAFSFFPAKNLGALGDGGAVVTNDKALADRVRAIRTYGSVIKYDHQFKGCNSRLDEIHASFLRIKLELLDQWTGQRKDIAEKYSREIKNPFLTLPVVEDRDSHVFHVYPILCRNRQKLMEYLNDRGIETIIHYPTPIPRQGAYIEEMKGDMTDYPVTEKICAHELSVPLFPGMTQQEIDYVIEMLNEYTE